MTRVQSAIEALEYFHDGVILATASLRVVYANKRCSAILNTCGGRLGVHKGRLLFQDPWYARELRELALDAVSDPLEAEPGCTCVVEREPPHPPVIVCGFRLPPTVPLDPGGASIMVILQDPERRSTFQWRICPTVEKVGRHPHADEIPG